METFKTILCPVDYSDFSGLALRYAVAFAQLYRSRLIVYHCIPTPTVTSHLLEQIPSRLEERQGEVSKQMRAFVAPYSTHKLDLQLKEEMGMPAVGILNTAKEEKADLIVIGSHGVSGYESLVMGSVTNKILHKAKVPVLTVHHPTRTVLSGDPDEPLLIGRIICAVDPRRVSLKMLTMALTFARTHRSTILFLSVLDSMDQQSVMTDLRKLIESEREESCRVEFMEVHGHPVQQILNTIEQYEADLVIMGHRSQTPLALEVVGSVTLRVIPRSRCLVLVVRD